MSASWSSVVIHLAVILPSLTSPLDEEVPQSHVLNSGTADSISGDVKRRDVDDMQRYNVSKRVPDLSYIIML